MSCELCIVMHKFLNIQNNETVTFVFVRTSHIQDDLYRLHG